MKFVDFYNLQKIHSLISKKFNRLQYYINYIKKPIYAVNYSRMLHSKPSEVINFKPFYFVLYTTDRCNLKCRWCLMNTGASKDIQHQKMKDMDFDTFKKILKLCPYIETISYAGQGEPLLNEDIFDMLEYAHKKALGIDFTSNIILLDDDKIKKIVRNKVNLNISLKGKDAKEFAEITQVGEELFHKQIENTRKLVLERKRQKGNNILRISYVVTRDNFRNMEEVIKLSRGLGISEILFDNLVPFHDFKTGGRGLFEDDIEIKEYIGRLKRIYKEMKIEFPVLLKEKDFSYYCPGYYKVINVDPEGNTSGCMRVFTPSPEYGNIFKDRDFMNTPHFRKVRKMHLNRELPARCKVCVEMSCGRDYP